MKSIVSKVMVRAIAVMKRQFPAAEHQQCWVHLSRTVCRYLRQKDRQETLNDLKKVYRASSKEEAEAALQVFLEKYAKRYPKLNEVFEQARESKFSFYKFPEAIRRSLYTTNLIERSNKGLKHKTKIKEQFLNEDSLERFVCSYYSELNRQYALRTQRGFKEASAEILQMFEEEMPHIPTQESAA